jgi:tRNA A-37 threonylcarbamoyl transferase component Bud32
MKNRSHIILGKTWGGRLQRRLKQPPIGIELWLEQHSETVKDTGDFQLNSYYMREKPTYLKLYRRPSRFHLLLYLLRRGRPVRAHKIGVILSEYGVSVVRPLTSLLTSKGVLVLTEGHYSGGDYCTLWKASPSREVAKEMMKDAGSTIAVAHTGGFTHGDCKWSGLVWTEGECYLFDLDRTRRRTLFLDYFKARDLARFAIGAEEAGADKALFDEFLSKYVHVTRDDRAKLIQRIQPHIEKLRRQRFEKDGIIAADQPIV